VASVVLYFQVHQPCRLKRYSVFDAHPFYFDAEANANICRKVADKCYRPATRLILDLVERHGGNFRCAFSLTGLVIEQMREVCPDVLDLFRRLADSGCVEFLGETYYHSLSFLHSRQEFAEQVARHSALIEELLGRTPRVLRNTELIYNNDLARFVSEMTDGRGERRFSGCLAEGVDRILGYRSPNYVYRPPGAGGLALRGRGGREFGLLLKNYRLSDDVAFRFSNRGWAEWPLSAEKFAGWVNQINGDGYLCNLFMDYETFGEHQWADTGIFEFLSALPGKVFDVNPGQNHFITPSEALAVFDPVGEYDCPSFTSWADTERDLTAWRGNAMQAGAMEELYRLEKPIKRRVSEADGESAAEARHLLEDWRRLTTSDHFYYMCTKWFSDGDVHKYFNPYDSPYDSYINYMNVLDNVRSRLGRLEESGVPEAGGSASAAAGRVE
jgi:alpha-amylase